MKDDRIEKEGEVFLEKVSAGFQELSKERKWKKVSATRPKKDVASEIQTEILRVFQAKIDF